MTSNEKIVKLHNEIFNDNKDLSYLDGLNIKNITIYSDVAYIIVIDSIDVYEIFEIGVLKEYRRKNIASKLIDSLDLDKDIFLEVREDNIAAIKLYEKKGFKKVSIRKNYYKDKNAIIMSR
ncbi:GNAT family N-acetyltransferase [Oceanivirga miroungae]|uniref:N-acetyltransferase GCN5 n=1 Tax=Oceanivirga miroungae TaxID=1130046 RepID=A0A6I8MA18_9FUSO|nr:GNAT family N-acetyltransferase [Oceanivirga miroungae]VWL85167.1 N-acetyltransferase GCN5 [Oceanivirga miroungae]